MAILIGLVVFIVFWTFVIKKLYWINNTPGTYFRIGPFLNALAFGIIVSTFLIAFAKTNPEFAVEINENMEKAPYLYEGTADWYNLIDEYDPDTLSFHNKIYQVVLTDTLKGIMDTSSSDLLIRLLKLDFFAPIIVLDYLISRSFIACPGVMIFSILIGIYKTIRYYQYRKFNNKSNIFLPYY